MIMAVVEQSRYLVVDHHALQNGSIEHLLVPVLQTPWFGHALLGRMAVKNVVVAFARRTRPDVCVDVAELLCVVQIADENLVVDIGAVDFRPEVVHRVQVGDVDTSRVRRLTSSIILLHVHAEQNDVDALDFLKGEDRLRSVRVAFGHLILRVLLQPWFDLADLVARCQDADRHSARLTRFCTQEVVHALLELKCEIGHGELRCHVAIGLALDVVVVQASLADEAFGPDGIEMQRTHLMPTARADDAIDRQFRFLNVVLGRDEQILRQFDERLSRIIADEQRLALDGIEALGAERVFITGEIETRRIVVRVREVGGVARNLTAELIAVAEHHLGQVDVVTAAAVAELFDHGIDGVGEHLGELRTHLVHARGLLVVQPGVVEHEPGVVAELQRVLVLALQQFVLHGRDVHGMLDDGRIVENAQGDGIDGLTERMRVFAGEHLLNDGLEVTTEVFGSELNGMLRQGFTRRIDLRNFRFGVVGHRRVQGSLGHHCR